MRSLIFILFLILLGFNGLLLWQNQEKKTDVESTCCFEPGRFDFRIDKTVTSVFPGTLGLIP
jgi:hypothetical protein